MLSHDEEGDPWGARVRAMLRKSAEADPAPPALSPEEIREAERLIASGVYSENEVWAEIVRPMREAAYRSIEAGDYIDLNSRADISDFMRILSEEVGRQGRG